ncbi:MAG: RtcB family protein [archaeon]
MELKKISEFEWEIPVSNGMNVPGKIFASDELIKKIREDKSLEQVKNVAKLPGIIGASVVMPDAHQGYGFSIGGVAAFDVDTGVISPGGVGYDINCSVRLLRTNLELEDIRGREKELIHSLSRTIPSGVGRGGNLKVSRSELDEILVRGARWMVEKGYGKKEDLEFIEENGEMAGADEKAVSQRAKGRGIKQIGTLGAGNHFLDILVVDEVFDSDVAEVFGLEKGQIVILIHCGSRGLGHQVASDYIKLMEEEYGFPEFDRELVNAPIKSELGKKYYSAMAAAANFAFANKQYITHLIRENLKHYFPKFKADVVYDICHNIAKFEKHKIDSDFSDFDVSEGGECSGVSLIRDHRLSRSSHPPDGKVAGEKEGLGEGDRLDKAKKVGGRETLKEVLVMRKGATRSFGPGRPEIPKKYLEVGQAVLLPGSMGTPSYVLVGTAKAEELSFGSTAHGAGRVKSRSQMHRELTFEEAKKEMESRGIFVEAGSQKGLIEESPDSYKDIEEVVRVSDGVGIGRRVARLKPLMVLIG